MKYAIELFFNSELENKINALIKSIADKKLSTRFLDWKSRPHVTLACFNDVDEAECISKLERFAQAHKAAPARMDSVGMFSDTKTVFLSPTMNFHMYTLQRELHQSLNGFDASGWEWYLPDRWVPHCTVALTREDGEKAFYLVSEHVLREFQKLEGLYSSIGLVKITFPVEEIGTFDLHK